MPANQVDDLTAVKQGACHGTKGDNCSAIPTAVGKPVVAAEEKLTCNETPNLNLNKDQPLLICTRQDIPPRMVFPGTSGAAGTIPSSLRLNSLSVVLVLDRMMAKNPDERFQTAEELMQALLAVARSHAGGRVVSMMEGGYDLEALAASAAVHVRGLMHA